MDKFPLTKNGFIALEAELKNLKGVERPNIIAALSPKPSSAKKRETSPNFRRRAAANLLKS